MKGVILGIAPRGAPRRPDARGAAAGPACRRVSPARRRALLPAGDDPRRRRRSRCRERAPGARGGDTVRALRRAGQRPAQPGRAAPTRSSGICDVSESKHRLRNVSRTFHGRDVFAPIAARLAPAGAATGARPCRPRHGPPAAVASDARARAHDRRGAVDRPLRQSRHQRRVHRPALPRSGGAVRAGREARRPSDWRLPRTPPFR